MNKIKSIIVLLIALTLVFGCTAPMESNNTNDETTTQTYTLEDVAMHSTPEDCWVAIEGSVYDVSPYIAAGIHPGGEAILNGCGKDATEMFNSTRDGEGHSQGARGFAQNYKIGELA
jgi:cytochrome b involved in lipid metabolism